MQNSVHLLDFPTINKNLIDTKMSEDISKIQTIVKLWLSWRARNKIRVRQPLSNITIWFDLEDYLKDIILEELNIKTIKFDLQINNKVQKIIKPNGKILWKKFWSDFKKILDLAKSWIFDDIWDWKVKVEDFILEQWEYEIDYINKDSNFDIEVWDGMVIFIDPIITPELEKEWWARDLIRSIQDCRKEADFDISDRISLQIDWDSAWFVDMFANYIEQETLSKITKKITNPDIEKTVDISNFKIKFYLKK